MNNIRCPICNGVLNIHFIKNKTIQSCDKFKKSHIYSNTYIDRSVLIKLVLDNFYIEINYEKITTFLLETNMFNNQILIGKCLNFDFNDPEETLNKLNRIFNLLKSI